MRWCRGRNRDLLGQLFGVSVSCAWLGGLPLAGKGRRCLRLLLSLSDAPGRSTPWGGIGGRITIGTCCRTRKPWPTGFEAGTFRALLLAAKSWEDTPAEVEARFMLGSAPEAIPARLAAAREVLDRGFGEITGWFRDKGPEWVQRYGG